MIAPNMATMLSVLVTDAEIAAARIAIVALSGGAAELQPDCYRWRYQHERHRPAVSQRDERPKPLFKRGKSLDAFQAALNALTRFLAQEVVRDGEGVTKFITLNIVNAASEADAERIGQTIGASVLTKSAFYGSDANWGRIMASAGRANVPLEPDSASLVVGRRRIGRHATRLVWKFSAGECLPIIAKKTRRRLWLNHQSRSLWIAASALAPQPSGPATSATNTSRSTAITARKPSPPAPLSQGAHVGRVGHVDIALRH